MSGMGTLTPVADIKSEKSFRFIRCLLVIAFLFVSLLGPRATLAMECPDKGPWFVSLHKLA